MAARPATAMSFLLLLETRSPAASSERSRSTGFAKHRPRTGAWSPEEAAPGVELEGEAMAPAREAMGEGEDRWELAGNSNFVLREE